MMESWYAIMIQKIYLNTVMEETFETELSEKYMKAQRNFHVLTDKSRST